MNKSKRGIVSLLVGLSLMGLTGCATSTDYEAYWAGNQIKYGYAEFFDSCNDYRLVKKDNDLWKEKLDGSESRQITHTPDRREIAAQFAKGGSYIVYEDYKAGEGNLFYYIIKSDSDDTTKKGISQQEYQYLAYEDERKQRDNGGDDE